MPTKQSLETVHKLWCDAKSFEQGMHDLAEELDRRVCWPDIGGTPRLRVGIDIGGTVSKYPTTFRHMVQAFNRAGNVAVHFISDMYDRRAAEWTKSNPRPPHWVWPFIVRWLSREYQKLRLTT